MTQPKAKRENLLLNIIFNIVAPSVTFSKLDDLLVKIGLEGALTPTQILIIAVSMPLSYGIYDYIARRNVNLFSILGFANVGLTGVIGVLALDGIWVAVKEASLPAVFGILVLASAKTDKPLIRTIFYNPDVIDVERIDSIIAQRGEDSSFKKLFNTATLLFIISSVFSVVMNFILARALVTSEGGTELFNEQMGRMTWISYIVIVIPGMAISIVAMWKLYSGIMKLTGLKFEELMHPHQSEK